MSAAFAMTVDVASLEKQLDADADAFEAAARPAAQAGAQVFYDQVMRNVRQLRHGGGKLAAAIYQAYSKDNSGPGLATYHISWNATKAGWAHNVEFGHLQRYVIYQGLDGQLHVAVRPEMQGKPKPGRHASQAVKDAYYVPLPGGPKQVAARPVVRAAFSQAAAAQEASEKRLFEELEKAGVIS